MEHSSLDTWILILTYLFELSKDLIVIRVPKMLVQLCEYFLAQENVSFCM